MDVSTDSKERRRRTGEECGRRLAAAREAAGLTEVQAATLFGLPRSTLRDYEAGAIPDAVRGGAIEDALGVPRGTIYRATDDDVAAANATPAPVDADAPTVAA